jgi:hypothetical protein
MNLVPGILRSAMIKYLLRNANLCFENASTTKDEETAYLPVLELLECGKSDITIFAQDNRCLTGGI